MDEDNVEHRCILVTANVFELKSVAHSPPVKPNKKINTTLKLKKIA
ncbi:hypothetical protein ACGRVM_10585 [Roseovarius aquimarinus]|uniref:Uncharacterized protein n=1 Tax=Roseovarius aquimarinus TaxID=1229156 RepID=A0ABW7I816_9RHOB